MSTIRPMIIERISARLVRLGMTENEVTSDLDLVRSGVLDSLSFVDLITDLEVVTGKQVDLEQAMRQAGSTTVKGVLQMFEG